MGLTLTVFHDGQFWVGLVERDGVDGHEIGRAIFGAEPSGAELHAWWLAEGRRLPLTRTSAPIVAPSTPPSPKRRQREAARIVAARGPSTRAAEALKAAIAERKQARTARRRLDRDADEERRWQLRVEKRKRKHRGR